MPSVPWPAALIWLIALSSIVLIFIRPKRLPEALWAVGGALLLTVFRLISPLSALGAIGKGTDVYSFLAGMMIMSELARREGVFDWVAGHAVRTAKGSQKRLFVAVYCVGVIVTVFLSNDATAVVLTPAILAAVRAAEVKPLPYLFACAFIANAASFVLPISNPANLVVYSGGMPPLDRWLLTFSLPSIVSILVTFIALRWLVAKALASPVGGQAQNTPLSPAGKVTLFGIAFLAACLMTASALHLDLGAPALVTGLLVAGAVSLRDRHVPADLAREVSWSVIPLVAGLFVIVEAVNGAGALTAAISFLRQAETWRPLYGALSSAFGVALCSNLANNLPVGLIAGAAVKGAHATGVIRNAVLIGVDLGPNLSITGSLATILWLIAIRREGQEIGFWRFLKWGAVVTVPALALAILATS